MPAVITWSDRMFRIAATCASFMRVRVAAASLLLCFVAFYLLMVERSGREERFVRTWPSVAKAVVHRQGRLLSG